MRAIECTLTQKVKKVALSLLHGAISFPEEPDLLASVPLPASCLRLLWQSSRLHAESVGTPLAGRHPQKHLPEEGQGRTDGVSGAWQGAEGELSGVRRWVQRDERDETFLAESNPSFLLCSTADLWLWLLDCKEGRR